MKAMRKELARLQSALAALPSGAPVLVPRATAELQDELVSMSRAWPSGGRDHHAIANRARDIAAMFGCLDVLLSRQFLRGLTLAELDALEAMFQYAGMQ
jgi:hypothetical protein